MPLLNEAIRWYNAGFLPLPVRPDGSKAPAVSSWTELQRERPSLAEVIKLFEVDHDGLGLLCGSVSGGLELFELEGRAIAEGYLEKLAEALQSFGYGHVMATLKDGYAEFTPGEGLHYYYRVADGETGEALPARRNTKLARRPATEAELAEKPDEPIKVLIETRGEGGFTVIAPSAGRSHPTGRSWDVVSGTGPESIPIITAEERDMLYAAASSLDQMPVVRVTMPASTGKHVSEGDGKRPGDDFNDKASWADILGKHGWKPVKHYGGNAYGWARPGKTSPGISATTGIAEDADRIYVFSTSTPFEPERAYDKFGAWAILNGYGSDLSAAARALRVAGYVGTPSAYDKGFSGIADETASVIPLPTIGATALALDEDATELDDGSYPFIPGGTFILDTDPNPVPIWGRRDSVLLASGEALIIAAPQGTGKTTLAGQLALGRAGFEEYTTLLGYPIMQGEQKVLYLAMDRPQQAARSLRRMVGDSDWWRKELDERIVIWKGPPPHDIAKHPVVLWDLCQKADADTVIVDSIKDAAIGLNNDEVMAGYNRARQMVIRAGVQVIELHHLRKLQSNQKHRAASVDELFGSAMISAGVGSVILLEGEPGASVVKFNHVKQPVNEVGPFQVMHHHDRGRSEVFETVNLLPAARGRLSGLSVAEAAELMFETTKPTENEKDRARRKLANLVKEGHLEVIEEADPAAGKPARYGSRRSE